MKRIFLLLLIPLFAIPACSRAAGNNPTAIVPIFLETSTSTPGGADTGSTPIPTGTTVSLTSSPSPIPSPTATFTFTPTALPTVTGWSTQVPDQFIHYYYDHINLRDYQLTWSLLSDQFKANVNGPATGGYQGYVNYWNTVQQVNIFGVTISSQVGGTAVVLVNMQYVYLNGKVGSVLQPFNLIYDSTRGTWLFDSPTPPAYQTPGQFIYYYFNQINSRNYPLTWSLLTSAFIARNNGPDTGGYDGYVKFWNSVARVDVKGVTVSSQTSTHATVVTSLVFNYTNGVIAPATITYTLLYDSWRGTWMFDAPTPPAAQTPSQFIYYYFNQINNRNYTLTWSLLTPAFITKYNGPDTGGYTGYVTYWNSVARVDVTSVSISNLTSSSADASVSMVFNYYTGVTGPAQLTFHLIFDSGRGTWLFDSP